MYIDPVTRISMIEILNNVRVHVQAMETKVAKISHSIDRMIAASDRIIEVCSRKSSYKSPEIQSRVEAPSPFTLVESIDIVSDVHDEKLPVFERQNVSEDLDCPTPKERYDVAIGVPHNKWVSNFHAHILFDKMPRRDILPNVAERVAVCFKFRARLSTESGIQNISVLGSNTRTTSLVATPTSIVTKSVSTRHLLDVAALSSLSKSNVAAVKMPVRAKMCFDPGILYKAQQGYDGPALASFSSLSRYTRSDVKGDTFSAPGLWVAFQITALRDKHPLFGYICCLAHRGPINMSTTLGVNNSPLSPMVPISQRFSHSIFYGDMNVGTDSIIFVAVFPSVTCHMLPFKSGFLQSHEKNVGLFYLAGEWLGVLLSLSQGILFMADENSLVNVIEFTFLVQQSQTLNHQEDYLSELNPKFWHLSSCLCSTCQGSFSAGPRNRVDPLSKVCVTTSEHQWIPAGDEVTLRCISEILYVSVKFATAPIFSTYVTDDVRMPCAEVMKAFNSLELLNHNVCSSVSETKYNEGIVRRINARTLKIKGRVECYLHSLHSQLNKVVKLIVARGGIRATRAEQCYAQAWLVYFLECSSLA